MSDPHTVYFYGSNGPPPPPPPRHYISVNWVFSIDSITCTHDHVGGDIDGVPKGENLKVFQDNFIQQAQVSRTNRHSEVGTTWLGTLFPELGPDFFIWACLTLSMWRWSLIIDSFSKIPKHFRKTEKFEEEAQMATTRKYQISDGKIQETTRGALFSPRLFCIWAAPTHPPSWSPTRPNPLLGLFISNPAQLSNPTLIPTLPFFQTAASTSFQSIINKPKNYIILKLWPTCRLTHQAVKILELLA